jgi:UDP-3-O-[3-hydroxymyristoyl] glucosamine N-acyltransferase
MYKKKTEAIYAEEIANFLNLDFKGRNCPIYGPARTKKLEENTMIFCTTLEEVESSKLENYSELLVFVPIGAGGEISCTVIESQNPQQDFIRILNKFFVAEFSVEIHEKAVLHPDAEVEENVSVGPHSIIGAEVKIGQGTKIMANVVLAGRVVVGENCVVKSNTTIGSEGFKFINVEDDIVHFPPLGSIYIGDRVWIGSNCTIERPVLGATSIENDVKLDDLVHIGQNSQVQEKTQIAAGSILCQNCFIGSKVWISPNSTINSDINIGENAVIGLGSVILKDISPDTTVAGNPGNVIKKSR